MVRQILRLLFINFLLFPILATANPIYSLFHVPGDPIAGNPNGKITVVEFFDYQCSHCIDMAPVISQILKNNKDVRIVFKDFPIRGPMSQMAARAALAANMQGKYYPFSHALLNAEQTLTESYILQIAKNLSLDVQRLQRDMHSAAVNKRLKDNYQLALDLKLQGTPAFYIGKSQATSIGNITQYLGAISVTQLQDEINVARK